MFWVLKGCVIDIGWGLWGTGDSGCLNNCDWKITASENIHKLLLCSIDHVSGTKS